MQPYQNPLSIAPIIKKYTRFREMAQRLRILTANAEDLGLISAPTWWLTNHL